MPDDTHVTVWVNQQQFQLVERLVREGRLGDSPAAVLREVLRLYAARHPELFEDASSA